MKKAAPLLVIIFVVLALVLSLTGVMALQPVLHPTDGKTPTEHELVIDVDHMVLERGRAVKVE